MKAVQVVFLAGFVARMKQPAQLAVIALLALIFTIILLAAFSQSRNYLIEANTGGASIVFGDGANVWSLPDSVLCVEGEFSLDSGLGEENPCNIMQRKQGDRREIIVDWERNTEIRLTVHPVEGLRIQTVSSEQSFPPQGSVIMVPKDAWVTGGALTFRALVTLGDDMRTGVQQYLREGRWEARDAGLATGLLRKTTEVVKSGELSTGAKVTVLVNDPLSKTVRQAQTFGHLLPTVASDAMSITLISELGDTFLSVRYFGVAEAVTLKPDWIDIAISSSLFLTATILLTILGATVQIVSQLGSKRRP